MSYLGNQPNSAAFLTDQFSGNGSTTAFTLSTAPAGTTSLLVSVSGVLQDPSTYSVVGTTLTLGGAAPTGTGNISVRYLGIPASGVVTTAYRTVTEFTATAGQTTFTPPSYSVGFIAVYLNGARLGASDFTASNGTTIILATGASVDDLVVTESFYISSVANAIPNIPGAVVESNIGSGAVTSAKLATSAALGNITTASITPTYLASKAQIGPVFYGRRASSQAGTGGRTKYTMDTATIDTHSGFNSSTNRWTVPVGESGTYVITSSMYVRQISGSPINQCLSFIYLNGSELTYAELDLDGGTAQFYGAVINHTRALSLVAGDYIEQWYACPSNFNADTRATGLLIERIR